MFDLHLSQQRLLCLTNLDAWKNVRCLQSRNNLTIGSLENLGYFTANGNPGKVGASWNDRKLAPGPASTSSSCFRRESVGRLWQTPPELAASGCPGSDLAATFRSCHRRGNVDRPLLVRRERVVDCETFHLSDLP